MSSYVTKFIVHLAVWFAGALCPPLNYPVTRLSVTAASLLLNLHSLHSRHVIAILQPFMPSVK